MNVVSDTDYRGKRFMYDVESRGDYFATLRRVSLHAAEPYAREPARRYAYILFERYQLPFPKIYTPQSRVPVAYRRAAEALEGVTTIELICQSIEDLTAPLLPPDISYSIA